MLTVMQSAENKRILLQPDEIAKGCWIDLQSPNDQELETVAEKTGMPLEMLKVALDEEERAHIEEEDGCTMIIVDTTVIETDSYGGMQYGTMPLGILYNDSYFVTVSVKESSLVSDFFEGRVRNFQTYKRVRNMLLLLQRNATKFLQHLKHIDKMNYRVQSELQRSMKNKEIIQLMELEKSLVYFATGINANEYVLEKVQLFEEIRNHEEDVELLDDVIVENKQAMEMCSIYSDILSGTMDAYASIVSNNLNIVMKKFTIITIILSLPTLIFSLWGINTPVPFEGKAWGFYVVLAIGIVFAVIGAIMILRMSESTKIKKTHKPKDKNDYKDSKK